MTLFDKYTGALTFSEFLQGTDDEDASAGASASETRAWEDDGSTGLISRSPSPASNERALDKRKRVKTNRCASNGRD